VLPSQIAFGAGGQSTYLKSYGTKGGSKSENSAFDGMSPSKHFHLINYHNNLLSLHDPSFFNHI